jgi:K+-transporting ATPase KdpF subunit
MARRCDDATYLREPTVNIVYALATLVAVALVGYLCVALLKPEWFE